MALSPMKTLEQQLHDEITARRVQDERLHGEIVMLKSEIVKLKFDRNASILAIGITILVLAVALIIR